MNFLLTGSASLIFLGGLLLIDQGLKKEDKQAEMSRISHVPARNYGRFFLVSFGILCVVIGAGILLRSC